ncbi:MAG: hypothetical protein Ct9H300mP11_23370 [Chloroflexota bacterium]|nr:MAG: hypothetical protein Ct9H300mP11_23370 [Chloroflexota bacterium]
MFPKSVFPDSTEVNSQDELVIGGCKVSDLASEYGTPVYVLDEDTLRARCRSFMGKFPGKALPSYQRKLCMQSLHKPCSSQNVPRRRHGI